MINPSIFKGFIQTRPSSLKKGRLRQFRERVRLGLRHQGINRIEQSIGGSGKTGIHGVTNLFECVTVHVSSAPDYDNQNSTRFGNLSQEGLPFGSI